MYILDRIRSSDDWVISLPLYHRGHLSLYPGTTVHLAPVVKLDQPRQTEPTPEHFSYFPEILGTTVQRSAWSSLYRISMALYDRPGVVHEVLRSIIDHGGDVLHLDSTSTDQEMHHNLELVVDFASLVDHRSAGAIATEIEGLLLADCAEHIAQDPPRMFRLRVRPVSSLRRADEMLSKLRVSGGDSLIETQRISDHGRLMIGGRLRQFLERGLIPSAVGPLNPPFQYFITSDTKDRVFRVTFVPSQEAAIWCSIRHADKSGALFAITGALKDHGMTLMCALNRVQEHKGVNWFETILSKPSWRLSTEPSSKSAKDEIRAVSALPALRDYSLSVFFERTDTTLALRATDEVSHRRVSILNERKPLDGWLQEKELILEQLAGKVKPGRAVDNSSAKRGSHLFALKDGIDRVRRATGRLRPQVFLSIEFTAINEERIHTVAECCRLTGFAIDVVRSSKENPVVWQEVLARVKQSTHFLAVWTPSEKKGARGRRPSPWCLWELGVANTLGLPFHVLIEAGTNVVDYAHIHGEHFYSSFERGKAEQFKRSVEDSLNSLARIE